MRLSKFLCGAALAGLGLLVAATTSRADTVTFGSFGTFGGGSGETVTNASTDGGTSTLKSAGTLTLTFVGTASQTTDSNPFGAITLGNFTLSDFTSGTFKAGDTFVIHVDQSVPGTDHATATYNVVGTVATQSAAAIDLNILTTFFTLSGGEHYMLADAVTLNAADSYTAPLTGTVVGPAAAPAPASLWGGAGLLGLMGIFGMRRRMRMA